MHNYTTTIQPTTNRKAEFSESGKIVLLENIVIINSRYLHNHNEMSFSFQKKETVIQKNNPHVTSVSVSNPAPTDIVYVCGIDLNGQ